MKKILLLLLLLVCIQAKSSYAQDATTIRKHITYLASDELGGRFPGTEGCQKAALYISKELKKQGYIPFFENGFQEFDLTLVNKVDSTKKTVKTSNIAYYKKGSSTPNEYIVVGAHYDHLGMGGYGSGSRKPDTLAVHNGADDNASGVGTMLACAEMLRNIKTDRSIIFIAFSAEEKGLIGSKYFVEHAPVPLRQIKAMLNLDMVGRLDSILTVSGTGTALQIDSLVSIAYTAPMQKFFQLKREKSGFGPSDQTSFCMDSIPVLFFHTSIHDQYHTPQDDVELINMKGCANISTFVSSIAQLLSRQHQLLTYQMIGNPQSSMGTVKVSLGIMPDHGSEGLGLTVSGLRPGGPAEKAGVLKNDIIMQIGKEKVKDIESYMNALNTLNKGQSVEVMVQRNGETKTIKVDL